MHQRKELILSKDQRSTGRSEFKLGKPSRLLRSFKISSYPYDLTAVDSRQIKWMTYFREEQTSLFLTKIPKYLNRLFGTKECLVQVFIKDYVEFYEKNSYCRGPANTVSKLKDTYGVSARFCASHSITGLSFTKANEFGLPTLVDTILPLLRGTINDRRAALFLLQLYKLVKVKGPDPSTNSITQKFPFELNIKGNYLGEFFHQSGQAQNMDREVLSKVITTFRKVVHEMFPTSKLEGRIKDLKSGSRVFNTSKSGPSGPAIASAPIDYLGLKADCILDDITEISKLTQNYELIALLRDQLDSPITLFNKDPSLLNPCSARLSVKTEVGAKTRLFAIGDYYTQSALLGFHKYLFRYLKGIPEDGTHSHNNVAQIVRDWTRMDRLSSHGVYSVDLTTATDRLPALFQREIVSSIVGKKFSTHWLSLMVKRELLTPKKSKIKYAVGQPMGFLSSWAMLAISHHVICKTALALSEQTNDDELNYVVIGDDVALRGEGFYRWYLVLMRDILQVPISGSKGFTCETQTDTNPLYGDKIKPITAEIAKRIFVGGEEITPVPPEAVKAGLEHPSDFPSLLQALFDRGVLNEEEIGPVPLIARLGFKPSLAVEFSCFPLFPAPPFKEEVRNYFEGRSVSPVLTKTAWYKTPGLSLAYYNTIFSKILRNTLSSAINASIDSLQQFAESLPEQIDCGKWRYNSTQLRPFLRIILYNMVADVEEIEIRDAADYSQTHGFGLKDKISGYHVVNDLDLMLRGKPRDAKDMKIRSNILLSKLIREVKNLTPLTYQIRSVSPEVIDLLHLNAFRLNDGEKPEYQSEYSSVMSFLLDYFNT